MQGVDLPSSSIFFPAGLFALAAVVAIALRGRGDERISSIVTALGGVVATALGVNALLNEAVETAAGWSPVPFLTMSFQLDALGAWFFIVLGLPATAAGIYAIGYLGSHDGHAPDGPERGWVDAAFAGFLGAMSLLFIANGVFSFLFAWELMALISFFLVIGDGRHEINRRAAFIYAVMTHLGTALILIAFLILGRHAGSWDFEAFRAAASSLGRWERDVVFLLALVGFGAKAGLIPLHIWLPRAHPAAPSHASALMSGVMVKTAIFGLTLVYFEFTAGAPRWWGGSLLVIGAISAVLGILYALMERDIKRLLAYSTVENVGLITIGLGAALLLRSEGFATASALALAAALFHTLNHALFKSLLFFAAGAVQFGAGGRDLERLGGLIRRMPATAAVALVGAAAIAALPPLNGFAGEWLLFQSLLRLGSDLGSSVTGAGGAIAAAIVALTAALAVAAFVRMFGMAFLAQPRSDHAREAREAPRSMLVAMALLASLCLALGVAPMVALRLLRPATVSLTGAVAAPVPAWSGVFDAADTASSYLPIFVVVGLVLVGIVPWIVARLLAGEGRTRTAPTWVCGVDLQPSMQYTATAFSKPIRIIFQAVIRPERWISIDRPASPYVAGAIHYTERVQPFYERYLYGPVVAGVMSISRNVREIQSGSVRLYLTFFFITLLVAIVLAR